MTKIQLSDFSYVPRPKASLGNALRFTISVSIEFPGQLVGEIAWHGNLCFRKADGRLYWSPPITRFAGGRTQQLHWLNPTMYEIVMRALEEDKRGLTAKLKTPLSDMLARTKAKAQQAWNEDPSLPAMIDATPKGEVNDERID